MRDFNWSTLDRTTLYYHFYSLGKDIVGKTLTPNELQTKIRRHVKQLAPIKIVKCVTSKNKLGYIYMGGLYHSDYDRKHKKSIEVNFHYHAKQATIKLTDYRWKRMSLRFADITLHELIHQRQFRARNFKSIPGYQSTVHLTKDRKEQEYFGDTDEMGAFAFNIACEMIDAFGYDPTAIKRHMDSVTRKNNSWWYSYLKAFKFNHEHVIIRRMKNLVMRQLENAYIGKPFKTINHLTY